MYKEVPSDENQHQHGQGFLAKCGGPLDSPFFANIDTGSRWLIENMIPAQGVVLLSGEPKLGKSTLAHQLCRTVVTGKPLFGKYSCLFETTGPSVLLTRDAFEHEELSIAEHVGLTEEKDKHQLYFLHDQGEVFTQKSKFHQLKEALEEIRPSIVVVDTLASFLGDCDENSASHVSPVISRFTSLSKTLKCPIVVIHHTNKSDNKRSVRGSSAITAGCSSFVKIAPVRGKRVELNTAGRLNTVNLTVSLERIDSGFILDRDPTRGRSSHSYGDLSKRIIEIVSNEPGLNRTQLEGRLRGKNLKAGNTKITNILQSLVSERHLKVKYGKNNSKCYSVPG